MTFSVLCSIVCGEISFPELIDLLVNEREGEDRTKNRIWDVLRLSTAILEQSLMP